MLRTIVVNISEFRLQDSGALPLGGFRVLLSTLTDDQGRRRHVGSEAAKRRTGN